tara:strand:- start:529 stop:717 length:189 start_codon:yes stop_codon:yes gene_type:complete
MTNQKMVYVVTRNSRRIEEENYSSRDEAQERAENLVKVLKKWKDPDQNRVKVVETSTPAKIR